MVIPSQNPPLLPLKNVYGSERGCPQCLVYPRHCSPFRVSPARYDGFFIVAHTMHASLDRIIWRQASLLTTCLGRRLEVVPMAVHGLESRAVNPESICIPHCPSERSGETLIPYSPRSINIYLRGWNAKKVSEALFIFLGCA